MSDHPSRFRAAFPVGRAPIARRRSAARSSLKIRCTSASGNCIRPSSPFSLTNFGLNHGEWKVLLALRRSGPPYRRSPGWLAEREGLSSGAMTNRLDRLEQAGLIQRLPDPDDRRALHVELTKEGHKVWEASTGAQAAKEAEIISALNERQQEQLTKLLRRLMLVFERTG